MIYDAVFFIILNYSSIIIAKIGMVISENTVERRTVFVAKAVSPLYCWLNMDDTAATGIEKPIMSTFSKREKSPAHSFTARRVITGTIRSFTKHTA